MTDMKHGGNVWEGENPGRWLDFSANLRPEGPPEWVMEAMTAALSDTRYYPDRAMRAARSGLARWLHVPEESVLPTAGGAAAIDLALRQRSGTVYVYPVTFGEYAERARANGREIQIWRGECGPGDTVMLCNPNNPTGMAVSPEEMLEIYRRVREMGGELVADEAFIDYCPENSVREHAGEGLTVVGSLTKALCIPGVRLGYVCGAPEAVMEMEKRALPWSLSTLASAVAAKLPGHEEDMRLDAEKNARRREKLAEGLVKLGAEVMPSRASFLMVNFHRDMTGAAEKLKEKGILVRTCASFSLGPKYWRLAVKTEEENARLLKELEGVLL